MIRDVIQQDDPRLRAENAEIIEFNKKLEHLISDLFETMEATGLSGLAAPQIAINKKIFVCRNFRTVAKGDGTNEKEAENFVFINPRIVSSSEATDEWHEGCGSVENGQVFGIIERPSRIIIEGLNEKDEPIHLKAKGFLARVIQHEFDHLNGIIFIDKLKAGTSLISKEEYIKLSEERRQNKKAENSA